MDEMFILYPKIYERAHSGNIQRSLHMVDSAPRLWERWALAAGWFFIATGKKLIHLATVPPQWEKETV